MKSNTYLKLAGLLSIIFFLAMSFIDNVKETKKNRVRELDPKVEKLKLQPNFKAGLIRLKQKAPTPLYLNHQAWYRMVFFQRGNWCLQQFQEHDKSFDESLQSG